MIWLTLIWSRLNLFWNMLATNNYRLSLTTQTVVSLFHALGTKIPLMSGKCPISACLTAISSIIFTKSIILKAGRLSGQVQRPVVLSGVTKCIKSTKIMFFYPIGSPCDMIFWHLYVFERSKTHIKWVKNLFWNGFCMILPKSDPLSGIDGTA